MNRHRELLHAVSDGPSDLDQERVHPRNVGVIRGTRLEIAR